MSMTQNNGAITLHEIDVSLALNINDVSAFTSGNDVRLTAYRLKRAYR
jgi:hypothetical protein